MKKTLIKSPAHNKVLEKLEANGAVIAAHSTGSGKTSLAWRAADKFGGNSLFVVPASLVSNMENAKQEFGFKSTPTVLSYERASNQVEELAKKKWNLVVFDEAHRLRNTDTNKVKAMREVIAKADHVLLLTATPKYHSHEDVPNLISLATKDEVKPEIKMVKKEVIPPLFDRIFKGVKPSKIEELYISPQAKKDIKKYIHVYDAASTDKKDDFPEVLETQVKVPMSEGQEKLYRYYESQLPPTLKWKIKNNIPIDKRDAAKFTVFANSFRQLSNGVQNFVRDPDKAEISPKIQVAVERLAEASKNPNFKAIVYSNFLASGLEPYKKELAKTKLPFVEVTGEMSKKEKDTALAAYNKGKAKVMLISSSGGEGLDAKGTRLLQILEPHFNDSKIKQVLGRASRYKSHTHLPETDRNVIIEHYLSAKKDGKTGVDEYLFNSSLLKKKHGEEILQHADH